MSKLAIPVAPLPPVSGSVREPGLSARARARLGVSGRSLLQAGVVLFDQGVCSLTNFLTGVLVARGCSKAEYGSFVLFLAALRFLAGIQNSVVSIPFTINHPRVGAERRSVYLGNTLVSQLVLSVAVGVLFFGAAVAARFGAVDAGTRRALDVLVLASVAFVARDSLRLMLLGQLHVWHNLFLSTTVALFTLGGLAVGHTQGALSTPLSLAIIGLGTGLPTLALGFLFQWRLARVRWEELWDDFRLNWQQGRWLTIRTFMYLGAFSVYPFFLRAFSTAEQVAAFGVCFSISALANPIFMGIGSYLRPKFSRLAARDDRTLAVMTLRVEAGLAALSLALVLFVAVWGQSLVNLLYGAKYSGLKWALILAAASFAGVMVELPFLVAAEARRNTRATFLARLYSSVFTLVGGLVLVACAGLYGAFLGLTLSRILSFSYLLGVFLHARQPFPAQESTVVCE